MNEGRSALVRALEGRVEGPLFVEGDEGYAPEAAAFNLAVVHQPDVVAGAASEKDVVAVVNAARATGSRIQIQGGGHGSYYPLTSGVLLTTRRLDHVSIDVAERTARIGAGARWQAVIAAAAKHGLAPITGSSTSVGVVGYLVGGGLGPLARSHGFSSDYVVGFTVVTGRGEVLSANATENADLFWALRGGKGGIGVITEVRIRLVPLPSLYAGFLTYDTPHIETAFRAWLDWTDNADPRVTTSIAIFRFPPIERIPEPFRGRHVMNLRFAYPGPTEDGARLAAPLRAFAPVYLDALGEMPPSDVARIHNDPPEPVASWIRGALLNRIDHDFVSALLRYIGPGADSPFSGAEVRHLGEATRRDVAGGSAVGGRDASFALGYLGMNPEHFARVLPEAAEKLTDDIRPYIANETNINYVGKVQSREELASAWPRDTYARLQEIRKRYDPNDVIGDAH